MFAVSKSLSKAEAVSFGRTMTTVSLGTFIGYVRTLKRGMREIGRDGWFAGIPVQERLLNEVGPFG